MSKIVCSPYLPSIDELRRRLYFLTILDIVMVHGGTSGESRLYSRFSRRDPQAEIFKIDNGAGDSLHIVFSEKGCIVKGFDQESLFSPYLDDGVRQIWPGIYDEVPDDLLPLLDGKSMRKREVTFCTWRLAEDGNWRRGRIPVFGFDDGGANFLLSYIHKSARHCQEWARVYYGREIPLRPLRLLFENFTLAGDLISLLNPSGNVFSVMRALADSGMFNI